MENDQVTSLTGSKSLSCGEVESRLSRYLDGVLSTAERKQFESHLSQCENCEQLVGDCRCIIDTAKELADRPVPAGVARRLRLRLAEEIDHKFTDTKPRLYLVK